jgi:hypothetical protein
MGDMGKQSPWITRAVAVPTVLLVLYLLSLGPAWWLYAHDLTDTSIYGPYVRPVWWLAETTGTEKQLHWYFDLWIEKPFMPIVTPRERE